MSDKGDPSAAPSAAQADVDVDGDESKFPDDGESGAFSPGCAGGHPGAPADGVNPHDPASPEMQRGFRGRLDADMVAKLIELRGKIDRKEVEQVFMEGLGGVYFDDILLRFLRATNWNVDQALERCLATMEWRRTFQETGVEKVTRSTCETALASGISFFCGVDKFGHPLAYVRVRLHSSKKYTPEEMRRVTVWCFEAGRAMLRPPVQMASLVFDMTGFGLSNMDYDYTKFLIATFRDYYPESLGVALVVNAPLIFKGCWKLIKGWMDPNTVSKIHFVSKKELPNFIPMSQLHSEFGGSRPEDPWPADPPLPGSDLALKLAATAPPLITSVDQQYEKLVAEKALSLV